MHSQKLLLVLSFLKVLFRCFVTCLDFARFLAYAAV
jgi:hypothetical protein